MQRALKPRSQSARPRRRPDVPTAGELALDASARELVVFAETPFLTMAWPFAAPPGVPAERIEALRSAFATTHHDAAFLAEAEKLGVDISPVSADAMILALDAMAHASPVVFDYMQRLLTGANGG